MSATDTFIGRVSLWNRAQARKHLTSTLRLAAKTAAENPSDSFVAIIDPTPGYKGYGRRKVDPNKLLLSLIKMGVRPDQITSTT